MTDTESYEYAYNEHLPEYEPSWVEIRPALGTAEETALRWKAQGRFEIRRRKVIRGDWEEFDD